MLGVHLAGWATTALALFALHAGCLPTPGGGAGTAAAAEPIPDPNIDWWDLPEYQARIQAVKLPTTVIKHGKQLYGDCLNKLSRAAHLQAKAAPYGTVLSPTETEKLLAELEKRLKAGRAQCEEERLAFFRRSRINILQWHFRRDAAAAATPKVGAETETETETAPLSPPLPQPQLQPHGRPTHTNAMTMMQTMVRKGGAHFQHSIERMLPAWSRASPQAAEVEKWVFSHAE
ncbi:MAG: hypothetical protein M1826_003991 [Phylliscum demangeonii]|nr:MAG: hypothetical protein M1826_003991 [Phylliscum demangeonii]